MLLRGVPPLKRRGRNDRREDEEEHKDCNRTDHVPFLSGPGECGNASHTALAHIAAHGSHHTDAIVAADEGAAWAADAPALGRLISRLVASLLSTATAGEVVRTQAVVAPAAPQVRKPSDLTVIQHIPMLVLQGTRDRLVHSTRVWVEEMRGLNMDVEYDEMDGADHSLFISKNKKNVRRLLDFFDGKTR